MRCAACANRGRTGSAVGEDRQRVVGRRIAVDADAVKCARANVAQRFLQKCWCNCGVGHNEGECRRQVGMNHSRAFSAADEMNSLTGHFEGSTGGFWTSVRRANGERQLREGTRGGAAIARELRQRAQNFFDGQGHANHSRRADDDFVGCAAEPLGRFRNGFLCGGMACGAGCAVRVACIHNHGAHAAFRRAQMLLGNGDRSGDHKILREHRCGRSRNVARDNREIERASFFQSAGDACEPESARKRCFGECVLHQRNIRVTSAPSPEATSSPPRRRLGCSAELRLVCSWRGS